MAIRRLKFFNGGFCRQWAKFVGSRSWGIRRFYAVFLLVEHGEGGNLLIDTGYSPEFFQATRSFPSRFYRWLTPVTLDPHQNAAGVLRNGGVDVDDLDHIIVSHFHPDHIGSLRSFPGASVAYRVAALQHLESSTRSNQLHEAFLCDLLPDDLAERTMPIEEDAFRDDVGGLKAIDYFGDGSMMVVDLPGHALGQMGFLIDSPEGPIFYVTDACWEMDAFEQERRLPWVARRFQSDYETYMQTQALLRQWLSENHATMLACHCPRTQAYVN